VGLIRPTPPMPTRTKALLKYYRKPSPAQALLLCRLSGHRTHLHRAANCSIMRKQVVPRISALPIQFAIGPGFMTEFETLDFSEGWKSLEREPTRRQLEERALPTYLSRQRWFGSKGTKIDRVELQSHFVLEGRGRRWLIATFWAHLADGRSEHYFIPLAAVWETQSSPPPSANSYQAVANIRRGTQLGTLRDALSEPRFIADLVRAMGEKMNLSVADSTLRFSHSRAYFPLQVEDERNIKKLGAEQSNSSILIANKMVLKAYRKLERGTQPELEMGRYLTDVAGYPNTPPLLGTIEQLDSEGHPTALALMHGFVANQGDGWSFTLAHLERIFSRILQGSADEHGNGIYVALAERLGIRVAELHQAFAIESGDPDFQPEPVTAADVAGWKRQIESEAETTFGLLTNSESMLPPEQHARVQALLDQQEHLLSFISGFDLTAGSTIMKTRFHGDLHLGQVLVAGDDFFIIDFEGEPARPFAQRRAKHSPLRDVAGMLRSFDYAAWSALFETGAGHVDQIKRLGKPGVDWKHEASSAFMQGYRKTIEGCSSCPAAPETFARLLDLFVLEKALYEVRYELANRPSWLRIPVEGIMSLLAHT
jgi:maltose alpha-D-glucosyltransferase/alpha-amylase